jgi:uncharacterized protein (DUF433 family)
VVPLGTAIRTQSSSHGPVAQLGARLNGIQKVRGSNPLGSTLDIADTRDPNPTCWGRITTSPDLMGGQPCIRGLRIPFATVVAMVADGMTAEEILADLPDLTAEDIREVLR